MTTLSAHHLAKQYKSRPVVKEVNLNVSSGEAVGLLGPNGAGKTTSFYMIVGLITPDKGTISLGGTDITRYPMHKRAQMGLGYLPQEASIFRKLSVADNIMAVLEVQIFSKKERKQKLESLLADLHIEHLANNIGMSLSGGERRRVEIARALASEPLFILLDEPFAGIDPISVLDIQRIIAHLRSLDIGILITDHNVRETLGICDRAYIVNEGQLIAEGTPESILDNEHVKEVYLGQNFKL
ncbi:sugar ABC transporter ATP-binding protein [Candidatus Thiomargarita nelsonii]|uniref:Lipopolysaccharide export system ATP-binding protein LptB n=1 Tax=Candidatus Thiomargarita nelsonii TaxID=1003181 RepID=A0A0A6PMF6_9GAMM|nr:sugar ABC transporter ATP-binding protein [Candidatus Thiomargarita nelsonii]